MVANDYAAFVIAMIRTRTSNMYSFILFIHLVPYSFLFIYVLGLNQTMHEMNVFYPRTLNSPSAPLSWSTIWMGSHKICLWETMGKQCKGLGKGVQLS